MAGHDDAQHRSLPASARKLAKAREEGQVARSRDLSHFGAIAVGAALLALFAPTVSQVLRDAVRRALQFDAAALARTDAMAQRLADAAMLLVAIALPAGALLAAVAIAGSLVAGGWVWTLKPLAPQWGRLNALAGLGRLLSKRQLADTTKACTLALLLGTLGALYLRSHVDDFGGALALPLPAALAHAGRALLGGLMLVVLALGAFALVDVPLQRWLHARRLRMSRQEVRQEHKELEGNIEIKAKVRARMREMASRRMLAAVPRADLVVTNPTHYAVALRYDEATMAAPRVVAKGADLLALRIRETAREAGVPVLEMPPLARALYSHAEVDAEIPAALFAAVAQVLAYVYQLRAALAARAAMPAAPPEVHVPAGLDPHCG
jgi:flagellar biosynthetic protein FlhB